MNKEQKNRIVSGRKPFRLTWNVNIDRSLSLQSSIALRSKFLLYHPYVSTLKVRFTSKYIMYKTRTDYNVFMVHFWYTLQCVWKRLKVHLKVVEVISFIIKCLDIFSHWTVTSCWRCLHNIVFVLPNRCILENIKSLAFY